VQSQWAELIVSGQKTVELRSYPLNSQKNYRANRLIAIYDSGRHAVVAVVRFSHSVALDQVTFTSLLHQHHYTSPFSQCPWRHGWFISRCLPLQNPVPFPRPPGSIPWVSIPHSVIPTIMAQC
jgi:hypothetical protein